MLVALPTSRTFTAIFLVLLLCLAAYVRVAGVGVYHYSPDELNHIELAQGKNVKDVLHKSLFEMHPPLGHLLRHYWLEISDAAWFNRTFSLLFGLALIPLYYRIGEELAGRTAGLYSAVLMVFSHGCIIQSYLVRNYTIFVFFLSCSLYAWLRWRRHYAKTSLLSYAFFGMLAVLTHFSGLFAIFSIAAVQGILLLKERADIRILAAWALANLAIAAVALAVMHEWQPLIAYANHQMDTAIQQQRAWFYPLFALNYLFASHEGLFYALALLFLVLLAMWSVVRLLPQARPAVALCLLSLLLGPALAIAGLYHAGVNRWSLWLAPCVIPVAGCALALLSTALRPRIPEWLMLIVCVLACLALYNPKARFADANEYILKESEWQAYENYLAGLDKSHLVIGGAVDAFLITYPDGGNLYDAYPVPAMSKDGHFTEDSFSILTPWHQTHILFKPYDYHYDETALIRMVQDAQGKGELAGADTLVFPTTFWSRDLTLKLLQCPQLKKEVHVFPPISIDGMEEDTLRHLPVVIVEVDKQTFLSELISPSGKARSCLMPAE